MKARAWLNAWPTWSKWFLGTVCVLLVVAIFANPWLAQHRGKSTVRRKLNAIVGPLIEKYRREQGKWPHSWLEIVDPYNPPDELEYEFICDYHPWRETGKKSLTGLQIKSPTFENGIARFELKLVDSLSWTPLIVGIPSKTSSIPSRG